MKLFIIEDEETIRTELVKLLEAYGYECDYTDEFEHVVERTLEAEADLVLLDLQLPFYDGYHVCREIRKQSKVPIIVVTSRNSEMDELMSMNLGADDYITKPYNKQILLAHIEAILRRVERQPEERKLEHNGVTLLPERSIVRYQEKELELTKNELRILSLLMHQKGRIVSRDEIIEELWQAEEFVDENTLTVNVNRLRRKLEQLGATEYIQTKRGQGYII